MLATSILSQIGVEELFHMASLIDTTTYRSFEVYAVTCGFYLATAIAFRLLFELIYRVFFAERVAVAELPRGAQAEIVVPP